MARPYITPSDVPAARKSRCLSFPDSLEWEALINGFLAMGTRLGNWQQLPGGITPEDAVAACVELLNAFFEAGECIDMTPIGAIQMLGAIPIPEKWLWCDGDQYAQEDYPELFAQIGNVWGGTLESGFFNVPDFSDVSPMGAGSIVPVAGSAGSETHTLTVNEIPSHNHPPLAGTTFVNRSTGGSTSPPFASSGTGFNNATTGNTGGSEAHNNLSPVKGVIFMIYAGR